MQLLRTNVVNFSISCCNKSLSLYCEMVTVDPLKEEAFYDVDLSW